MLLRESINERIEELDKFFEDNFDQPFVFNFEKGRIRLKKLLMYEPGLINQLDNGKGIKGLAFGLKPLKENTNADNITTNGSYVNDKEKQGGATLKSQNSKPKKTNNRSVEKHKPSNSKTTKPKEHVHKKKEHTYSKPTVKGNQYKHNGVDDCSYEDNSNHSQNTSLNVNSKQQQQHNSSSLLHKESKPNHTAATNEGVTLTRNNNNVNNSNNSLAEQGVSNNNNNELLRGTAMSFKPSGNLECSSSCNNNNNSISSVHASKQTIEKQTNTNNKEQTIEHEQEHKVPNTELKEITLRFKLTEEEYRLLLREKAKIIVQIPEAKSTEPLIYSTAIPNLKKSANISSKKPFKQRVNQLYHQAASKPKYK